MDASVALKWVLDDEDAIEQSAALRDDCIEAMVPILAPSLWLYEIAHALVVAERRHRLPPGSGNRLLRLLHSLGVVLVDPEIDQVYRFARRFGLTVYDAACVALAEAANATLWTGDRRLAELANIRSVRWIGEYERAAGEG